MAYSIPTTQSGLLDAVLTRLRTKLSLPDERCYETIKPLEEPKIPPGGGWFLTVSPGGGVFDEEQQIGGGIDNVIEKSSFTVGIYSKISLDRTDRAAKLLKDDERGLLKLKKLVLRALAGWMPTDKDGNGLATAYVFASQAWTPQTAGEVAILGLGFSVDFAWDLTEDGSDE